MARILIVEDNPVNRKLAALILQRAGHTTVGAADADEADRLLEKERPELILMDVGLPGRDGFTFTRELRGRTQTRHIPIIAVTSFAMKGDRTKAMEAGCSEYITKPIDRLLLVESVARLLEKTAEPVSG